MSLYCECPRCGGKDEFAMCENALMKAWVESRRPLPIHFDSVAGKSFFSLNSLLVFISFLSLG